MGLVTGKTAAAGVATEVVAVVIAVPGAVAAIAADTVVAGNRETVDPGTTAGSAGIPTMTVAARAQIGMMIAPEGTMTAANVAHDDLPAATMGAVDGRVRRAGASLVLVSLWTTISSGCERS